MRNDNIKTLCWTAVAPAFIASVTAVRLQPSKQLGPNYVAINGHDMRRVSMQVSDTEFAMSCDWHALREDD